VDADLATDNIFLDMFDNSKTVLLHRLHGEVAPTALRASIASIVPNDNIVSIFDVESEVLRLQINVFVGAGIWVAENDCWRIFIQLLSLLTLVKNVLDFVLIYLRF